MYDEVADLQVAEVGQERARGRSAALVRDALLIEDVGLGPELQRGIGQPEAFRQMTDRDEHSGRVCVFAAIDERGGNLVVGEELDNAVRAPL